MARFWVEIIDSGAIESASTIDASTPIRAAEALAKEAVTFRRNEERFIKVTPTGAQQSFQFVRA